MKPKQPAGPAMTLGNMRELGVQQSLVGGKFAFKCTPRPGREGPNPVVEASVAQAIAVAVRELSRE